jgi:glycosyltransferase involved in cell wall biosynthesis
MQNARISIVIPTKNEGKYIGQTLAQFAPHLELFDLEIIVSDAHSTDETARVVRDFSAKFPSGRVRFVEAVGRQNIAIGRNAGAVRASGELLLHMDADVRVAEPDKFFQNVLRHFAKPGIVAATVPLWVYPEESKWNDRAYHWLMNTTIRLSCLFGLQIAKGECQIVRRSAFEAVGGYSEKLVAGEDCDLFYRLGRRGRVVFLPEIAVHHSPRRFRQLGYAKVSWHYLLEGLSRLFLGRSFAREWRVVR